jgi:3-oxoacyl-ACP reductase-like protein
MYIIVDRACVYRGNLSSATRRRSCNPGIYNPEHDHSLEHHTLSPLPRTRVSCFPRTMGSSHSIIALSTVGESLRQDAKLEGKYAVVTGASSGIGLETAIVLTKAGAHVVMGSRGVEKERGGLLRSFRWVELHRACKPARFEPGVVSTPGAQNGVPFVPKPLLLWSG